MKIALKHQDTELDISGYNKCLEEKLVQAIANDNADEAAKVFHVMLCNAGMTGNPKPDLQEMYVAETLAPKFLDANGKPKDLGTQEYDFELGLVDDVKKYLGVGEWDDPNNMVKHDEFFLSTMYSKYGHDNTEEAIDYVEGKLCQ